MASLEADDEALLQRVARGDEDALLLLHKRYVNLVYSMAWRVLQDVGRAEEVTQDIFIKLWQKGHRYDPARGRFLELAAQRDPFRARSTGSAAMAAARLRPSWRQATPMTRGRSNACCPTDHDSWERGQHLRLLLAQLPAEQRQIIELAYFGGLTHSELAEHLGLPLGTVKGRLRLGLEKLRALWLDEPGTKQ